MQPNRLKRKNDLDIACAMLWRGEGDVDNIGAVAYMRGTGRGLRSG